MGLQFSIERFERISRTIPFEVMYFGVNNDNINDILSQIKINERTTLKHKEAHYMDYKAFYDRLLKDSEQNQEEIEREIFELRNDHLIEIQRTQEYHEKEISRYKCYLELYNNLSDSDKLLLEESDIYSETCFDYSKEKELFHLLTTESFDHKNMLPISPLSKKTLQNILKKVSKKNPNSFSVKEIKKFLELANFDKYFYFIEASI